MKTYTTFELATILHKDPSTIRRYCQKGLLKAEYFGRSWVIYADIDKLKLIDHRLKQHRRQKNVNTKTK